MTIKINPPTKINNETSKATKNIGEEKAFVNQAKHHKPLGKTITGKNDFTDEQYPWNAPMVREDVTKLFNLRLTEPDWLKLKYISDNIKDSMHSVCLDILIPAIHRRLKKLIESEENKPTSS